MELIGFALAAGAVVGLVWAFWKFVAGMGKGPKPGSALDRRMTRVRWSREDFERERAERGEG
jgi:hypothetical protein